MAQSKPEQTYITLGGLKVFKNEYDKKLKSEIEKHTHTPDQIVETAEKKFVSETEKTRWNDTYTKSEADEKVKTAKTELEQKIDSLEKARVWKPSVATFEDIAKEYPEPKDTWCVITKDTNTMWIYEEKATKWIDLGHSVIHENATAKADGLMSKEDKAKLDKMEQAIEDAKKSINDGASKKNTELENKITEEYKKADKAIEEKLTAIEKAYQEADTAVRGDFAKADKVLEEKATAIEKAYKEADSKLDEQIKAVDAKFISATDEEITALFA